MYQNVFDTPTLQEPLESPEREKGGWNMDRRKKRGMERKWCNEHPPSIATAHHNSSSDETEELYHISP